MRNSIEVCGAGKRYVKYDDTPMLVTRVARLKSRTNRSSLWALRDITFDVGEGEVLGIIGRNGSGKSTLLRMLAGVTAPTEGSVRVVGQVAPLISVGVGFHRELTGRENVFISGTVLGLSRKEIARRLDAIVDFAEIAEFIDTPVKFYSSGMYVRLGFAVSIFADPDVLLVDEVLAVGDIAFQLKCFDRISELQKDGCTIVVVSHNLAAIRNLCQRTILLHDGNLCHDGATDEAISLFHQLLGEERDIDSSTPPMPGEESFDERVVVTESQFLDASGRPTRHLDSGQGAVLSFELQFVKDVENPLIGVSVMSSAGVHVYGEVTDWRSKASYRSGDRVCASVKLNPRLATGSYSVSIGIVSPSGVVLARPPQPLLVFVSGRNTVQGIADLGATFELTAPERADPLQGRVGFSS